MTKQKTSCNKELLGLLDTGNKDEISQSLLSLIYPESNNSMWKDRTSNILDSIISLLVYKRDHKKELISTDLIIETANLKNIYKAWKNSIGVADKENPNYLPTSVSKSLSFYLSTIPGFTEEKSLEEQSELVFEQHGYLYNNLKDHI